MSIYDTLNEQQREGVFTTEGPVLILAGAGSGKTRVITHRIAYLIEELGVNPYNIMAITFTNKAAGEMRERVDDLIGFGADSVWVSTFHSTCVRFLRRYIDRIGYDNNFTIYDTDDQKSVMKDVCKRLQIDTKNMKEKSILSAISSAKNEMITPEKFLKNAQGNFAMMKMAEAYREYQEALRKNNALDFDDLLLKTVELFEKVPEVLEGYQKRFKYMMVDEYQDTNTVQFRLISLLASRSRNLCVVGDDDQSIYKFRGANIRNILDFEEVFPDACVIKLEQNYRSVGNILSAANEVIKNNRGRKSKALWTDKSDGDLISFKMFENGFEEAEHIARDIEKGVEDGEYSYNEIACLYRTNAQSRSLEEKLIKYNIPYKIFGGQNFYQRKEIKDVLAYMKTALNGKDDVATKRIINVPKRGIGATSISRIDNYALNMGLSFFEALDRVEDVPNIGKAAVKIGEFVEIVSRIKNVIESKGLKEGVDFLLEETGYLDELKAEDTDEARDRIENINEFLTKVVTYEQDNENPTLEGFLEEVALIADIDSLNESEQYVALMTIHSAKGLEFPKVYLSGVEEGLFPSYMTIQSDDPSDMEEERRLAYVAITRAMKNLCISCAKARMIRGETQYNRPSRFIKEIPSELIDTGKTFKVDAGKHSTSAGAGNFGGFGGFGGFDKKASFAAKPFAAVTSAVNSTSSSKPSSANVVGSTINKSANGLDYVAGDRVRHIKFGEGTVLSITDGGRDYEVLVNFDTAGQKKMFASFAKLKKL